MTAESDSVLRSSAVMALGTTASRVLGFVRAIVIAAAIQTSLLADTYNVGNTLPNILYILVAGGAINAVFVPQLVRAMKQPDGGARFTDALLTAALLGLAVLTVAATLAAPWIVSLYANSSWRSGPELGVATTFAYWCLPQIFFYGLYTIAGQVLNARGRFGPMMWAPVLNNLIVIATGALFIATQQVRANDAGSISSQGIALLGFGTTLGIAAQALVLVPVLRASGYRYRPRLGLRGIGLGRTGVLASWTLGFVAVNQVAYLVVVRLATGASKAAHVGYGVGISAYQNAYLIFVLPHSIATVSLVAALLPRMSRAAAEGRLGAVRDDVASGLRTAAVATVPAAIAFLALGRDMTALMYARSGRESATYIGVVLTAFAAGLVAFSAQHLVLRGFYALEDTRTPFFIQVAIGALNVALVVAAAAFLPARLTTVGMAAGYALSYAGGLALSTSLLSRRLGSLEGSHVVRTHVRLFLAAGLPGVAAWGTARSLTAGLGHGVGGELAAVAVGGAVLVTGFALLVRVLHIAAAQEVFSLVTRRLGR